MQIIVTFIIKNHFVTEYVTTNHFYHMPNRIVEMVVVKLVNLDASCKNIGCYDKIPYNVCSTLWHFFNFLVLIFHFLYLFICHVLILLCSILSYFVHVTFYFLFLLHINITQWNNSDFESTFTNWKFINNLNVNWWFCKIFSNLINILKTNSICHEWCLLINCCH